MQCKVRIVNPNYSKDENFRVNTEINRIFAECKDIRLSKEDYANLPDIRLCVQDGKISDELTQYLNFLPTYILAYLDLIIRKHNNIH